MWWQTVQKKTITDKCRKQLSGIEKKVHIRIDFEQYYDFPQEYTISKLTAMLDDRIRKQHIGEQKHLEHIKGMNRIRRDIYANPAHKWTVDEMARSLTLSRAYFQRLYKENFGLSVSSDIITARITYAKRLIKEGKLPIYIIAEKCGYSSEIYFMQQFKKETGLTPTQYQNQDDDAE